MEKEKWFEKIQYECEKIEQICYLLDSTSIAFERTGNEKMADALHEVSESLRNSTLKIKDSVIMKLNNDHDAAYKRAANIIKKTYPLKKTWENNRYGTYNGGIHTRKNKSKGVSIY